MADKSWMFLAWAPFGRRSEFLAKELGAELHFVHYLKFQKPAYAPFKYLLQAVKTNFILLTKRPKVVFVQNPPIFCAMIAQMYSLLSGCKVILDHHSDAFSKRWEWILPLQKRLVSAAALNLVTTNHWVSIIESWGGKAKILEDALPTFPPVPPLQLPSGVNVVMINTYADDEPLDEVIQASRSLPLVQFHITGNKDKLEKSVEDSAPSNVHFTGFLPDDQYIGLLKTADAIMALTTRDNTLQGGGFEAVSLGRPLITSNWPLLRQLFQQGTLYVDNSAAQLIQSIEEISQEGPRYSSEMTKYCAMKRNQWKGSLQEVLELI